MLLNSNRIGVILVNMVTFLLVSPLSQLDLRAPKGPLIIRNQFRITNWWAPPAPSFQRARSGAPAHGHSKQHAGTRVTRAGFGMTT